MAATEPVVTQPAAAVVPPENATRQPTVVVPQPNQSVVVQEPTPAPGPIPTVTIVSHSTLFYWWPVWVCGYILAAVTYFYGDSYVIGDQTERFYTSTNLGVIFFLTLFSVILITNVTVRGLASAMVVLAMITVTVLLAYSGLWDRILGWFANLHIHLNYGAYFWFSTLMLFTWLITVFVIDPMSYWRIKPGQITRVFVLGAASTSYDTENLVLEKFRDDLFRHWVLGMGSGDIRIHTHGARQDEIYIPNVLFVGSRIHAIQRLIAERPAEFGNATVV
jgi:hypothetical protein